MIYFILIQYGKIEALVVPKKNGKAMIEFSSAESAVNSSDAIYNRIFH